MLEDHVRQSVQENPQRLVCLFVFLTFSWASMTEDHGLIPTSISTWTELVYKESSLALEKISFCENPSSLSFSKANHIFQEYPEKTEGRDKPIIQQRHKLRAYKGQVLSYYWSGQEPWREQTPTALHYAELQLPGAHLSSKFSCVSHQFPFSFFLLFTIKSNGLSKHINLSHGGVAPVNPGADFPNWCAATVTVTTGSDGKTSSRLLYYLYFPPLSLTQQVLQKWWEHCFPLCVTLASVTHPSPHNAFPPCCWARLTCGNRDTRLKCSLPLKAL